MIKKISSPTNPQIKAVCELHHGKYRKERQQFIAEGLRNVQTLVDAGYKPITFFTTPEQVNTTQQIAHSAEIIEVPLSVMEKMSAAHTPSGILGVFAIPKTSAPITPGIVLAQIADPGNMGTLIRSAVAFGAQCVIIVEGCDPWSPKVIQASAGTIANVPIHELTWNELVQKKGALTLCALVVDNGKHPKEIDFTNTLMVVGNEANGLPSVWVNDCELTVTLPMSGKTESLNAAVAGSIALYLAQHQ